jgi:hypothetical protein
MTWLPCQLSVLRTVPSGVWTVCYHHNSWTQSDLAEFKSGLARYRDSILSLEELRAECRPSQAKWCYHFCTSPRLSALVLRAHLKLSKMWRNWCDTAPAPAVPQAEPPRAGRTSSEANRAARPGTPGVGNGG